MVVVEEEVWGKFGDRWGHQWAASLLLGAASSKDLSRFCVFIYFDKFCHFNPIQGNDNRTERPFIILSILAKVGADLEAHFRFQANKLSVTNTIQISTLLHICLSFFPLFVAGNSMKPFPLLIAALTIRWRISDTLSSVSVFQCFSQ